MAWTVAFALLGALLFALLIAPVLCTLLFKDKIKEWRNPVFHWLQEQYGILLDRCFVKMRLTMGLGLSALAVMLFLCFSGVFGSVFLLLLDEGELWFGGTLVLCRG